MNREGELGEQGGAVWTGRWSRVNRKELCEQGGGAV